MTKLDNKNITALIAKLVMTFVAAWIAFGLIENAAFSWLLLTAVLVTAVNYVIGDLYVLPRYRNIVASVGNGIMAAVVALIVHLVFPGVQATLPSLILFFFLIAVGEYFFHRYLLATKAAP